MGGCARRGVFLALVALLASAPAQGTIRYTVSLAQPEQHFLHLTMTIPGVKGQVLVQLPAWNALYQIRDFAYHIPHIRGSDQEAQPLTVRKLDKQTWSVTGDGTVTIEYRAYWDEAGPFGTQLNDSHAFLNLAMILFYVPDRRGEAVRLAFENLPSSWRVGVELPPDGGAAAGKPVFTAVDYQALVDAPVEIGAFEEFRLEGMEPPVRVIVHGDGWNRDTLAKTLKQIVSYQVELMRGAPYTEYLFIFHLGRAAAGAGGGMEHANSTAIHLENAAGIAGITAHEFFHLWNVKRIRPQSLEPVDYTREQRTPALWFAEGVTSTVSAYTLVRTGLWSADQFYDDLAFQITELRSRSARLWKSAEETSEDAWFEKYPLYRRPDFSVSYYNQGQILGVLLDIALRDATDNRKGLDDLLRALNEDFAKRGRFYGDSADIRVEAERLAGPGLGEFFTKYVSAAGELPCAEFLARAGLTLKDAARARTSLGFVPGRGSEGQLVATQLEPDGNAVPAGVREGDTVVKLNGSVVPRNVERWLRDHQPGETVRLTVRHEGREKEIPLVLGRQDVRGYVIEENREVTDKQRRIRRGVLHGTTD